MEQWQRISLLLATAILRLDRDERAEFFWFCCHKYVDSMQAEGHGPAVIADHLDRMMDRTLEIVAALELRSGGAVGHA